MNNESEKLARFKKAVFDHADKQVQAIIEEAEKQRDSRLAQAKLEAESFARTEKSGIDKTEEARAVREISSRRLASKRNILCYREKIIDKVFESVREKLAAFRNGGEYEGFLLDKAERCRKEYPGEKGIAYLAPSDMKFAEKLAGFEVRSKSSIELGGMLVVYERSGVALDYTFDSAFEEQREGFTQKAELTL